MGFRERVCRAEGVLNGEKKLSRDEQRRSNAIYEKSLLRRIDSSRSNDQNEIDLLPKPQLDIILPPLQNSAHETINDKDDETQQEKQCSDEEDTEYRIDSPRSPSCPLCSGTFRDANEARRHFKAIHLRQMSWSCGTIASYHAYFTSNDWASKNQNVCSMCGMEFFEPADWKKRLAHLLHAHNLGQCDLNKKFYRADHFRQHLKHTHRATMSRLIDNVALSGMKHEFQKNQSGQQLFQKHNGFRLSAEDSKDWGLNSITSTKFSLRSQSSLSHGQITRRVDKAASFEVP